VRQENLPRGRVRIPTGTFNLLGAAYSSKNVFGLKAYFAAPGGARFHVMLFSALSGKLLAIIEADRLGQIRTGAASTGAASGMATRLLARARMRRSLPSLVPGNRLSRRSLR
jgi:alanine dehydrogenase